MNTELSSGQLQRAAQIQAKIEALQKERDAILSGSTAGIKPAKKMSDAARKKIAANVKKRWAEAKKAGKTKL